MKYVALKRKIVMPFANLARRIKLAKNVMKPFEILQEEKKCHELMILANRNGHKDAELEYRYKRDILRKVLGQYGSTE